jgi:exopolysaccharide biosynthesis protein
MTLGPILKPKSIVPTCVIEHITVDLPDSTQIDVDVARYLKSRIKPRVVVFEKQASLLGWCREHKVENAINGGFTMHHEDELLGEIWSAGKQYKSTKFASPWHNERGSIHIAHSGHVQIAPRHIIPEKPKGDLLQAGPLLVHKGYSQIIPGKDPEGISASSDQFDDDWTGDERYPRSAVGANDDFIFCVAVNGYKRGRVQGKNTGLSLGELADLTIMMGATEALNLDGGSNVTLIANGKIINKPSAGHTYGFATYPEGRPIPNAIIFEPVSLGEKFSLI